MLKLREIQCKTLLNKSDLADFTLNCYVGCTHRCLYCYARYMKKFKERPEDWGEFVDVKINAPEILAKQIKKIKPPKEPKRPKEVYMSTVCDGWQPIEEKYRLSRDCLKILLEAGFDVSILTKSSLIKRDFDLLAAYNKASNLGVTITTLHPKLSKTLEPYASDPQDRINVLKEAQEKGIKTWVFLGPLVPVFTDTEANLEAIFSSLKDLDLEEIYIDRLNPRWGVLENLKKGLIRRGEDYNKVSSLLSHYTSPTKYQNYSCRLKHNALKFASKYGLSDKLRFCF